MAFPFLQRGNPAEHARQLTLEQYTPEIHLSGLSTGVDNIRVDVYLSVRFTEVARHHILRLLAQHGGIPDFISDDPLSGPPSGSMRASGFIGARPSGFAPGRGGETADFKKIMSDLHLVALHKAKAEGNISIDLLARLAVLKFLRAELVVQYGQLLERGRARMKAYEGPRAAPAGKAVEMRERFARFQISKKPVIRKAGQEIFATVREIEKESLAKMRRSFFGEEARSAYDLFLNRLLFTEDGRDDYLNAEHYVMLGNFDRDPDKFQTMLEIAVQYLQSLNLVSATDGDAEREADAILNVSSNAQELVAAGTPDEATPKGKAQRALLAEWVNCLEKANVMDHVIASYEVVKLLDQYAPPINPQQLKNALISRTERKRVEGLLEEQGRISPENLNAAVKRVEGCRGADRAKIAGRYLSDFIRYHRDLRRLEALLSAMDGVNVIANEKLRELSSINNTLYEFLLPEEQKTSDASVASHVILKADIRDSTTLTRTLFERGLNPASYFSLNFFDPVNKLLAKYEATKVFIEGDALILALFERNGEQSCVVGRTCVLAREMIQIVHAYNEQSRKAGLPTLELGLGICYQDSAPMYLMDGSHRIMISKALNESDRLSGCSKGARRFLGDGAADNLFNVYGFQTVDDADTEGIPDEFLVRYNIGGIQINAPAFEKLRHEVSLTLHEIELPMLWDREKVRLYTGLVPIGHGLFHSIVVREAQIAWVDPRDFSFRQWTAKKYYEVCVNSAVHEYLENMAAGKAGSGL